MKILNRKNASLVLMTTLLGMPLTQVMAEPESTAPSVVNGQTQDTYQQGQVPGVTNDRTQDATDDGSINDQVKSAFSSNNDFRDLDIDVKTENGEVTLSGEVSSQEQRNMAISRAKEIKGVKNVNADDLEVTD